MARAYNLKRLLVSSARRIWFYSPMRREAVRRAKRHYGQVECAQCLELFGKGEWAVDHINPVVDVNDGFVGFDAMYKQLFCSADELQVLCKPCHKIKTAKENAARKKKRR